MLFSINCKLYCANNRDNSELTDTARKNFTGTASTISVYYYANTLNALTSDCDYIHSDDHPTIGLADKNAARGGLARHLALLLASSH